MGLEQALLSRAGVRHAFGTRGDRAPPDLALPRQVHGARVVDAEACAGQRAAEADAVVAATPGCGVGVVTADCVPVLAGAAGGAAVAAIHAGWRGLAAGVVEAGIAALHRAAPGQPLVVAIGPHIGACCYEVDAPVLDALRARHAAALEPALAVTRPGHWKLDLGALVVAALEVAGVEPAAIGTLERACTACDPVRFHSYRRDGARSGRLVHWIRCASASPAR